MKNLTKYELLQHRHLSLLKALEAVGIHAFIEATDKWSVKKPDTISSGEYRFAGLPSVGTRLVYAREWYEKDQNGKVTAHKDAEELVPSWVQEFEFMRNRRTSFARNPEHRTFSFIGDGDIYMTLGNKQYAVKCSPEMHELLDALTAAIVAASPAKVD
jgi:hypothetical protein